MEILLNNKNLGISYIHLKRNEYIIEDKLLLKFDKNYRQSILNLIENEGKLKIIFETLNKEKVVLYNVKFKTNYIFLLEEYNNVDEILLQVNMSNIYTSGRVYNQYIIDILYDWSQDINIDWGGVSVEKKEAYLRACYFWRYDNFIMKNIPEIHIDGKFVNCEIDLYYYLAKNLIGERGYFGMNLDSLEDLLIDVEKNNIIDTIIHFDNVETLIQNTSTYFFETIISLLKKSKFVISLPATHSMTKSK